MTPYNFLRGLEKIRNSKTIVAGEESAYVPILPLLCLSCIALVHFFVLIEHCNLFPTGYLGPEKNQTNGHWKEISDFWLLKVSICLRYVMCGILQTEPRRDEWNRTGHPFLPYDLLKSKQTT